MTEVDRLKVRSKRSRHSKRAKTNVWRCDICDRNSETTVGKCGSTRIDSA